MDARHSVSLIALINKGQLAVAGEAGPLEPRRGVERRGGKRRAQKEEERGPREGRRKGEGRGTKDEGARRPVPAAISHLPP